MPDLGEAKIEPNTFKGFIRTVTAGTIRAEAITPLRVRRASLALVPTSKIIPI